MSERTPILKAGFHQISLADLRSRHDRPVWVERVVMTDEMQGVLICQPPGHPTDMHYHNHDEWWLVLAGEIDWEIEGQPERVKAKAGDFIFVPKRHYHHIHVVGNKPAIRLAISVAGEKHLHEK